MVVVVEPAKILSAADLLKLPHPYLHLVYFSHADFDYLCHQSKEISFSDMGIACKQPYNDNAC